MHALLSTRLLALHEDYELPPLSSEAPLTRLMKAIGEALTHHPELQAIQGLVSPQHYPGVEFPAADAGIPIDILLCANNESICLALDRDMPTSLLGVFATSAGSIEPDEMYATRLRVIVSCDEDCLRQHMAEERALSGDPHDASQDRLYLDAFLNTLPHELAHAVEFIEHAHGLSPADIDDLYDAGDIDFDIVDACNGRGIRSGVDAELDQGSADFIMEERVEQRGREWLGWALQRVDPDLISACLEAYAPSELDVEFACAYY